MRKSSKRCWTIRMSRACVRTPGRSWNSSLIRAQAKRQIGKHQSGKENAKLDSEIRIAFFLNRMRPKPQSGMAPSLESPVQLRATLTDSEELFQVSSVLYNSAASKFIHDHGLANTGTWKSFIANQESLRFDRNALVVKEMWEAILPCNNFQPTCVHLVNVWSPTVEPTENGSSPDVKYPSLVDWSQSVVEVNTDTSVKCDTARVYPVSTANSHLKIQDQTPPSIASTGFKYHRVPDPAYGHELET